MPRTPIIRLLGTASAPSGDTPWYYSKQTHVVGEMLKNVASQIVGVQMITAADGSAFTGSVTCYVTGDGGVQAAGSVGSGACTSEGNGYHTYAPAQAETNYNQIAFTFTGSGAIPATLIVYTDASYDRLGAPVAASISADLADVEGKVDDLEGRLTVARAGYLDNLSAGAVALEATAQSILTDTAVIGAAGAGLTAVPWNAAWDAEVQSECADALSAYDPPTKAELDSAVLNVSVDEIQASALADLFNTDSGTTYAAAGSGSVVKEIADNAGASSLTVEDIADGILNRDMSIGTDSGSPTVRTVRQALRFLRNKWSVSGTTLTVTKEDDATTSWTAEVTTDAAANPITASDPASS